MLDTEDVQEEKQDFPKACCNGKALDQSGKFLWTCVRQKAFREHEVLQAGFLVMRRYPENNFV